MRQSIEPISGNNLAAMGDDEIGDVHAYWSKRLTRDLSPRDREVAESILSVVAVELAWRNKLKLAKCPMVTDEGNCRSSKVAAKYGASHRCPRIDAGGCTLKKMSLTSKFKHL